MAIARKASIGSISENTLKTYDLIDSFAYELSSLLGENSTEPELLRDCVAWLSAHDDGEADETGLELVKELIVALQELAPPYCYFGANEGDGACYGFWPCMESVNELPRVENSDEAKALGEDCVYVNDHGNVTVYGGDGSVIWDCV